MKVALTIAGSDPSGGSGIQADLKTFTVLRVYGTAVLTTLTIQSSQDVHEVVKIPPDILTKQLVALFEDVPIAAVKTGILLDGEQIRILHELFERYAVRRYVLDPIVRSPKGFPFLKKEDVELLKRHLFPLATVVTPNLHEVEALTGIVVTHEEDMHKAAKAIQAFGPRYVLIMGGQLDSAVALDLLYDGTTFKRFEAVKRLGQPFHGAGGILTAAITAGLAQGLEVPEAVAEAKQCVTAAIEDALAIGGGRATPNILAAVSREVRHSPDSTSA